MKICPLLGCKCLKEECEMWVIQKYSTPIYDYEKRKCTGWKEYTKEYCGLVNIRKDTC